MLTLFYLLLIYIDVYMFTPDVDDDVEFNLHYQTNQDLWVDVAHCRLLRKSEFFN